MNIVFFIGVHTGSSTFGSSFLATGSAASVSGSGSCVWDFHNDNNSSYTQFDTSPENLPGTEILIGIF